MPAINGETSQAKCMDRGADDGVGAWVVEGGNGNDGRPEFCPKCWERRSPIGSAEGYRSIESTTAVTMVVTAPAIGLPVLESASIGSGQK